MGFPTIPALVVVILAVSSGGLGSEPYTGVAALWDLGAGARPVALGDAFAGMADDGNALVFNPAGLAWGDGLSVLSSLEIRPATSRYENITVYVQNLGLGVYYFDFGDILETDEFGNAVGTFSYRNYGLIVGTGVSAASLPVLSGLRLAPCIAFGLNAKLLIVDTLESGDGRGFAGDLSLLLRVDDPWFGKGYLSRFSFGILAQNLLGAPIAYESGHNEGWNKNVAIGISAKVLNQLTASFETRSSETAHLGFEWTPVPFLALRCGVKAEGIWIWTIGLGIRATHYSFDYALVVHPYLSEQHRASFEVSW